MNNPSKLMFYLILITGTMITVSSNSWLSAWMGLEINLLSFIPLMSDNNLMSTEASLKYFLTQALASVVLLFSVIFMMLESFSTDFNPIIKKMIMSSLLMKSGSAPFHFWFPNLIEGLSWINALILLTWQKIAPLMLISYLLDKNLLIISSILSSIIGAIGGLNQTSLRKLMAYSSINHLGWMMASMYTSEKLWGMYFLIYSFLSITLILMFNNFKMYHINQLFSMFTNSKLFKFFILMNMLSLGGLPPFLGFLPKWLLIQDLSMNGQLTLMMILTTTTLIALFFYLRLCYTSFMMTHYQTNWTKMNYKNNISMKFLMIMSFFSVFGLFLISLIFYTL